MHGYGNDNSINANSEIRKQPYLEIQTDCWTQNTSEPKLVGSQESILTVKKHAKSSFGMSRKFRNSSSETHIAHKCNAPPARD